MLFLGFLFSATPDQDQDPHLARKNDAVAAVHHHHLRRDQEAALLAHVAAQGLIQRVPVLDLNLGQSLTRAPDHDLQNIQVKTVQGRGGLVFVL